MAKKKLIKIRSLILFAPCLLFGTVIYAVGPSGPSAAGINYPAQLAAAAGAGITVAQSTQVPSGSGTAIVTFQSAVTAGNMIICGGSSFNSSGPGMGVPTDTGLNTYVQIGSAPSAAQSAVYLWYAKNVNSTVGDAVTATDALAGNVSLACMEVSGANTVTPLDKTASRKNTTDDHPVTSSMTATNANELVVMAATHDGGASVWSAPFQWTLTAAFGNGAVYIPLSLGYKGAGGGLVSGAPGYAAEVKLDGNQANGIVGAVFKP